MKNRKWTQIVLHSGFIIVFIILLAMEDMGVSRFYWDTDYPMRTSDKVTFFIITSLKCILTCLFLLLRKETYLYRVIASTVIGTLTTIWLILLGWTFYWHVLVNSDIPILLLVSEVTAMTTNLIILFACIWSLRRSRRKKLSK